MKRLATSTAIATLLAGAAFAQDTTVPTSAEPAGMGAPGAMELGEEMLLGSQMLGMQVFARPQEGDAPPLSDQMATEDLAAFVSAGQISDTLIGRDGTMRGLIVALPEPVVPPGEGYATSEAGPVGTEGLRFGNEVMIPVEAVTFVADETTPNIWWAVLDMSPEDLAEAQPIDRGAMATPLGNVDTATTGTLGGTGATVTNPATWRGDRTVWTAPTVAREGYRAVPASEVSAENLQGATVYGATGERIGNVEQIVLGADPSQVGYVVLDIGGFLGMGGRNVAIGLDEMTILRTEGWDEVQVHVDATEETLRSMREYQG